MDLARPSQSDRTSMPELLRHQPNHQRESPEYANDQYRCLRSGTWSIGASWREKSKRKQVNHQQNKPQHDNLRHNKLQHNIPLTNTRQARKAERLSAEGGGSGSCV